ncbi:hypothetical protein ACFQX7_39430 [Luedemannella flava]
MATVPAPRSSAWTSTTRCPVMPRIVGSEPAGPANRILLRCRSDGTAYAARTFTVPVVATTVAPSPVTSQIPASTSLPIRTWPGVPRWGKCHRLWSWPSRVLTRNPVGTSTAFIGSAPRGRASRIRVPSGRTMVEPARTAMPAV